MTPHQNSTLTPKSEESQLKYQHRTGRKAVVPIAYDLLPRAIPCNYGVKPIIRCRDLGRKGLNASTESNTVPTKLDEYI